MLSVINSKCQLWRVPQISPLQGWARLKNLQSWIGKYCISFWKLEIDIKKYCIKIELLFPVEPALNWHIENLQYDIFWYKIPTVLFRDILKYNHFLLQSSVSSHFKLIVPFCVCVLPIVTTWNRVFLSETGGKSRLCFGKTTWNWVFDYLRFVNMKRLQLKNLYLWQFTFGKQKFL